MTPQPPREIDNEFGRFWTHAFHTEPNESNHLPLQNRPIPVSSILPPPNLSYTAPVDPASEGS